MQERQKKTEHSGETLLVSCGARSLGRSERGGLHTCRFYFPLEHIVFSEVLASEKFSPTLGEEEWFKPPFATYKQGKG